MKRKADLSCYQNLNWTNLRVIKVKGSRRVLLSDRAVHYVKMFTAHKMGTLLPPTINGVLHATVAFARWLAERPHLVPQERCFEWADLTVGRFS